MAAVGSLLPIYARWQQLSDLSQDPVDHPNAGAIIVRENENKTINITPDDAEITGDLFVRGKLTLKSSQPTRLILRDICVIGGELYVQNITLVARYRILMTSAQFSSAIGQAHPLGNYLFSRDKLELIPSPSTTFTLTPDVNARGFNGLTALLVASHYGDLDVANFLLSANADPNIQAPIGRVTALHYATIKNNPDMVTLLIKGKANLEAVDARDATPLVVAAQLDSPNAAEQLIKGKADINAVCFGHTPMEYAVKSGAVEIVRILGNKGARFDQDRRLNPTCMSPELMYAVIKGHVRTLEADYNTEATNDAQQTLLSIAARYGHLEVIRLLLNKGAIIDARDRYGTALTWAAEKGEAQAVELLLSRKATVETDTLMFALEKGHTGIVNQLVHADLGKALALFKRSAKFRQADILKILVGAGAEAPTEDSSDLNSGPTKRARFDESKFPS